VETAVGAFCRKRGVNPVLLDYSYEVRGLAVTLFENRADWRDPTLRHVYPFARFKFIPDAGWELHWMRQNGRWYRYDEGPQRRTLTPLIHLLERDEHGAFFG
jgi:hypothetical protein